MQLRNKGSVGLPEGLKATQDTENAIRTLYLFMAPYIQHS